MPRIPVFQRSHVATATRRLLAPLLVALLAGVPVAGRPATPAWPAATFSYLATNESLEHVLTEFGRTFGLRVELTPGVVHHPVRLNGNITTATPDEFLNRLGMSHGAQWFQHGGTLYASLASEGVTRALPASGVAGIRQALTSLGVVDARFGWADLPERSTVIVTGPPAYVELVSRTLATLPPAPADLEVRMFRLRHATVDDRTIQYRDKEISTAGMATLIRSLIGNQNARTGTVTRTVEPIATSLQPAVPAQTLGSKGDAGASSKSDEKAGTGGAAEKGDSASRVASIAPADNRNVATIQADSRLNALIVRDRPERMPLYEQLIASLDVPSLLIQIEAMIIDVDSSSARKLGVDWQARRRVSTTTWASGGYGAPDLTTDANSGGITLSGGPGLLGNYFTARISALESSGEARVVSRPSVLTVDNLGALIDLSETLYISAIGERVANVVPVSVGTTLKVTPHVIEHGGQRSVQLTVDIEDGAIVDTPTNGQPRVRRSTVGTQAVMAQDESLLIGGFRTEQDMRQNDRIPVIGDLPVIGALFGKKSTNSERRERMFVLTPRIIEPSVMQQAAKAP